MTCDKETYNTYQLALAALKGLVKRGLKKLKAYKCKDCGCYHLSSVNDHTKKGLDIEEQKLVKDIILGMLEIASKGAGAALGAKTGKTGF